MATVFDVAAYILDQLGEMTAWKLQKLVYYSQAWSLVWDEKPLFEERIEAWANGPVCPALYNRHARQFTVSSVIGADPRNLAESELETVNSVIRYYGGMSGQYLSDLTHAEKPWREAREDLAPGVNSNAEITWNAMADYYGSLPPDDK